MHVCVTLRSKGHYRVPKISKRGLGGFERVLGGLQEKTQGRAPERPEKAQRRAQEREFKRGLIIKLKRELRQEPSYEPRGEPSRGS